MRVKDQKCDHDLVEKENMFYWRGRYFTGLVCEECNSLYDNPKDSFMKYVYEPAPEPKGDCGVSE